MHNVATPVRTRSRATAAPVRTQVLVDCLDAPRRDLIVYWLLEAGHQVRKAAPAAPGDALVDQREGQETGRIVITDRFGPGRGAGATIQQMKQRRPELRVIVVGGGGSDEAAMLSLARAAGADATLPAAFACEELMRLLQRWA
jgi:DNA-binding NtrC family response regulator